MPVDFGQGKKVFEHLGKEVVRLLSHIDQQMYQRSKTLADHVTVSRFRSEGKVVMFS